MHAKLICRGKRNRQSTTPPIVTHLVPRVFVSLDQRVGKRATLYAPVNVNPRTIPRTPSAGT